MSLVRSSVGSRSSAPYPRRKPNPDPLTSSWIRRLHLTCIPVPPSPPPPRAESSATEVSSPGVRPVLGCGGLTTISTDESRTSPPVGSAVDYFLLRSPLPQPPAAVTEKEGAPVPGFGPFRVGARSPLRNRGGFMMFRRKAEVDRTDGVEGDNGVGTDGVRLSPFLQRRPALPEMAAERTGAARSVRFQSASQREVVQDFAPATTALMRIGQHRIDGNLPRVQTFRNAPTMTSHDIYKLQPAGGFSRHHERQQAPWFVNQPEEQFSYWNMETTRRDNTIISVLPDSASPGYTSRKRYSSHGRYLLPLKFRKSG